MKAEFEEQRQQDIIDLLDCQRRVLERIATGAPLDEVLLTLATLVERLAPELRCAILRVDGSGRQLEFAAAPNIPEDFQACMRPLAGIGPTMCNCGRAAFLRKPVYTEDVALDPHWLPCRDIALRNGMRAVWSTPILSDDNAVLGTFAMFYKAPGLPSEQQFQLIEMAVQMARVAIQSKHDEERLRASEREIRDVIDNIPAIAWTAQPDGRCIFANRSWQEYTGQTPGEAAGWGWTPTVHPEDAERHVASWREAVASGKRFESEARYRRADGLYRWFMGRGVPLRNERGEILRWYGILVDIEARKSAQEALHRSERVLRESAQHLRHLSRRLLGVQEEERRHLSRELHDRLGETLTALSINLSVLKKSVPGDAGATARIEDSVGLVNCTAEAIDNIVAELRPPMLDDLGLAAALDWYGKQFSARSGIAVAVQADGPIAGLAPDVGIALFRVAQEALNNVAKHARARHVAIALRLPRPDLVMSISDDGIGLPGAGLRSARRIAGLGLVTMRERAQAVGGRFEIERLRGRGTRLTVTVPLP